MLDGIDAIVDAADLPFPEEEFDVVFMVATDYYVHNIEKNVKEVSRVLKPEGIFINATYKTSNLKNS